MFIDVLHTVINTTRVLGIIDVLLVYHTNDDSIDIEDFFSQSLL